MATGDVTVAMGASLHTAARLAARRVGEMFWTPAGESTDAGLRTSIGVEPEDALLRTNGPSKPKESTTIFSTFKVDGFVGNGAAEDTLIVGGVSWELVVSFVTCARGGIRALDFCWSALGIGSCLSVTWCNGGMVLIITDPTAFILLSFSDAFFSLK